MQVQTVNSLRMHLLPHHIIKKTVAFLQPVDILELWLSNKHLHQHSLIKVIRHSNQQLVEGTHYANIFFRQVKIQPQLEIEGQYRQLVGIRFSFSTKDQGWASVESSHSWIEAEFIKTQVVGKEFIEEPRMVLVQNHKQKHFKLKRKWIEDPRILKSLGLVNIYARSQYPGWQIYCKHSEVELIYV